MLPIFNKGNILRASELQQLANGIGQNQQQLFGQGGPFNGGSQPYTKNIILAQITEEGTYSGSGFTSGSGMGLHPFRVIAESGSYNGFISGYDYLISAFDSGTTFLAREINGNILQSGTNILITPVVKQGGTIEYYFAYEEGAKIGWGRATENWTDSGGHGDYVLVQESDQFGNLVESGASGESGFPVVFPYAPFGHPNAESGNVVIYAGTIADGYKCTSHMDERIGSVKMWFNPPDTLTTVPQGWTLCDGSGATHSGTSGGSGANVIIDMRGKFPVSPGRYDYGASGGGSGVFVESGTNEGEDGSGAEIFIDHRHDILNVSGNSGSGRASTSGDVSGVLGYTTWEPHLPPYRGIHFIQRYNNSKI